MKLPDAVAGMLTRFDAMSMRERVLVAGACLVGIVMGWMLAFLDPTSAKQRALGTEMASLQQAIAAANSLAVDPTLAAQRQQQQLEAELAALDAQLASTSAGLIAPERMVQVIRDVLSRQRGVTLVSLHNAAVTTLVPATADAPASSAGPYVHRIEIVVDGSYLDVLAYLQALEKLEWRFYWRLLELRSTDYPVNRVRIELSTLSLDKDWIGV